MRSRTCIILMQCKTRTYLQVINAVYRDHERYESIICWLNSLALTCNWSIGSEFNAHRERSHVANWMRITRLFDFSKGYITLFLAFNDAFVALNFHYKAFSPPSALYLLASAHALNAIRFQSTFNPPPEVDWTQCALHSHRAEADSSER